ncbi:hypothetical protein K1X76_10950 [bacterium]|nr:hypothetical protein [bacterium]
MDKQTAASFTDETTFTGHTLLKELKSHSARIGSKHAKPHEDEKKLVIVMFVVALLGIVTSLLLSFVL